MRGDRRNALCARASFFDIDGVVYDGTMGIDFLVYLDSEHMLSAKNSRTLSEIRQPKNTQDPVEYYKRCVDLWIDSILGKKREKIVSVARRYFSKQGTADKIFEDAVQAIKTDRFNGYLVVGITGSPIETMQALSDFLNSYYVHFHYFIGGQVAVEYGRYTSELVKPWPAGEGKVDLIKQIAGEYKIDLARSKAYGNSVLDLSILETVGTPVVVNAKDKLKQIAQENSWKIKRWSERI